MSFKYGLQLFLINYLIGQLMEEQLFSKLIELQKIGFELFNQHRNALDKQKQLEKQLQHEKIRKQKLIEEQKELKEKIDEKNASVSYANAQREMMMKQNWNQKVQLFKKEMKEKCEELARVRFEEDKLELKKTNEKLSAEIQEGIKIKDEQKLKRKRIEKENLNLHEKLEEKNREIDQINKILTEKDAVIELMSGYLKEKQEENKRLLEEIESLQAESRKK